MRMHYIANRAINELKIGDLSLGSDSTLSDQGNDIQTQLLQETRQKLFGRNISARGSILSVHDELWFFPTKSNYHRMSIQLQTAFEHFNEYRSSLRMTTGSPELDSLIDSIQEGQFYLFYGANRAILDGLVHGILVNCVLSVKEHVFESMVIYINNVDYYQRDKSNILSPEKIAVAAKFARIEPKIVFKNLFVQIAYTGAHQLVVAKQVSDFIESEGGGH